MLKEHMERPFADVCWYPKYQPSSTRHVEHLQIYPNPNHWDNPRFQVFQQTSLSYVVVGPQTTHLSSMIQMKDSQNSEKLLNSCMIHYSER